MASVAAVRRPGWEALPRFGWREKVTVDVEPDLGGGGGLV